MKHFAARLRYLLPLLLFISSGCGKVGDPLPPRIRVPAPVGDLRAIQNQFELALSWTNPGKYVDGSTATDLSDIEIFRDGNLIKTLKSTGAGKLQSATLDVHDDVGKSPVYTLVVKTERGRPSTASNALPMKIVEVPAIVTVINGYMDQGQIRLNWTPPVQNPAFAEIYLVRRADWSDARVVKDTHYEDSEVVVGMTYRYIITAARASEPVVPGPSSIAVSIVAKDIMPPRPPTGLLPPVISESGAVLRWDENSESDRAGYRVYRRDNPNGVFVLIEDAIRSIPNFSDSNFRPGSCYKVQAVDTSGNWSEQSEAVCAMQ